MDSKDETTVEESLAALSAALGRAADDLTGVRATLDLARADIASRNTALSRDIVVDAARAVSHLRQTDENLRDLLRRLSERD